MPRLPALKANKVIRALERAGFYVHHQTGSHARLLHRDRPEFRVTVPRHTKDLPRKTLSRILKQTDLTQEQFRKLL